MNKKQLEILEAKMTPSQKKKREEIILSMKKNKEDMKKRYGDRWEDVMYATATKQAIGEAKKAKPDFLDVDKDGNKKEPMKKALKDKKKINEGVLDSTDDDGWMAKSQLYQLAKYAAELHKMINDSDDLEPWVQAKITGATEDISAVKHYMEYLLNNGNDIDAVSEIEPEALPEPVPSVKKDVSIDDILRSPMSESKKKSLRNKKDNPCWNGYEPVGTKEVKGKTVPNCVPKK